MKIQEFARQKKYIFWDIDDFQSLSVDVIVEHFLNYGDMNDIRRMFEILGTEKVAEIFFKQISRKRHNYNSKVKNYFQLYFKKYA